jgi:acyl carrier protein
MSNIKQEIDVPSGQVNPLQTYNKEQLQLYLSELWKQQLKLEYINLTDDFMKAGGQSVDMFRMLAKIENDFDKEIDFDDFFENPTIAVLSDLLLRLQA